MKKSVALICLTVVLQPVWSAQFQNLDFDAARTNVTLPIPRDEGDGYPTGIVGVYAPCGFSRLTPL